MTAGRRLECRACSKLREERPKGIERKREKEGKRGKKEGKRY